MKRLLLVLVLTLLIPAAYAIHLDTVPGCPNIIVSSLGPGAPTYWYRDLSATIGNYSQHTQRGIPGSILDVVESDVCVATAVLASQNGVSNALGGVPEEVGERFIETSTDEWKGRTDTFTGPGQHALATVTLSGGVYSWSIGDPFPDVSATGGWFRITEFNPGYPSEPEYDVPEFSTTAIILTIIIVGLGITLILRKKKH
ncbi:hypothetical protein KY345_00575 [Candidatus Woesearchaeota archaeon]|nr:hypothetical protein [Candidatus Woesearchaeota archaeon]